ncbi:MAG: fumarylacetoacetate hydrolase family protein [Terriglobales bacterium]
MKLVTFENAARQPRIGALLRQEKTGEDKVVDLQAAGALIPGTEIPDNMRALFAGGGTALNAARQALNYVAHLVAADSATANSKAADYDAANSSPSPQAEPLIYSRSEVQLQAPIIPKKFFHTAGNFREHHEEATKAGFSHPVMPWIVFFQNTDAIIGPDAPVIYPEHLTEELDYELELAVVLKKSGKHFTAEEAPDYIGGYVIFNDITARDIQRREMKSGVFSFCKGIDTFCPLGPWIVTADEIPDPHNLAMELRVNGQPRQRSHSSKMSVTIPEILAHYSPMGYSAGDVVSTGTVSGVAAFSGDPKAWYLKPGDVMECEIEKIGILRNPVISWEQAYGKPAPPRRTPNS